KGSRVLVWIDPLVAPASRDGWPRIRPSRWLLRFDPGASQRATREVAYEEVRAPGGPDRACPAERHAGDADVRERRAATRFPHSPGTEPRTQSPGDAEV